MSVLPSQGLFQPIYTVFQMGHGIPAASYRNKYQHLHFSHKILSSLPPSCRQASLMSLLRLSPMPVGSGYVHLKNEPFENSRSCPLKREKVWADLSGDDYLYCAIQPDTCIASPEEEQLVQLNEELLKVKGSLPSIPAVQNYISQPSFRLMFLRSKQGNPAAAAKQIVKHLHLKEYLFGNQALAKDIELEDLNEQDMAALSGGALQWLFQRDRGQRLVYLVRARDLCETKLPPDSILRAHFYHGMEAARDEQNQRLGFVMVNYFLDDPLTGGANYELFRRLSKFENAMPLRCVAHYIAFQNTRWKPVADVICHLVSPKVRVRTRTIFGKFHIFGIAACLCCMLCCISMDNPLYYCSLSYDSYSY
jgi:hypothetical protein